MCRARCIVLRIGMSNLYGSHSWPERESEKKRRITFWETFHRPATTNNLVHTDPWSSKSIRPSPFSPSYTLSFPHLLIKIWHQIQSFKLLENTLKRHKRGGKWIRCSFRKQFVPFFSAKNISIQHTTTLLSFHFRFVSFYLLAHCCCFTPTKRQKKRGKFFFLLHEGQFLTNVFEPKPIDATI